MANRLCVAEIHSILTLYERGWSCRRIARELGVHRETVGRYVRGADRPPPGDCGQAPPGSAASEGSKPAKAPTGSRSPCAGSSPACGAASRGASVAGEAPPAPGSGSPAGGDGPRSMSDCLPHHAAIVAGLEAGLTAMRIWQDLHERHGTAGAGPAPGGAPSYYSVRRYVKALRHTSALPYRRIECEPGLEAQVDFGTGAAVVESSGRRRRTHVLRIVLSHSRKGYSEAVYRQTTDGCGRSRCTSHA